MTQTTIKNFVNQIYSKRPEQNYITNNANVCPSDDIWSLDILVLKDYGPEDITSYRYVLVVIDKFSKFGWTVTLKNKNAQTKKDCFENFLLGSKRKLTSIEIDRGKEL